MEVNTNFSANGVGGTTTPKRSTPTVAQPAAAPLSFASSSAVDQAVQNLPASRPEAVERARQLAADPNYPSSETLRQVSSLLADHLAGEGE